MENGSLIPSAGPALNNTVRRMQRQPATKKPATSSDVVGFFVAGFSWSAAFGSATREAAALVSVRALPPLRPIDRAVDSNSSTWR